MTTTSQPHASPVSPEAARSPAPDTRPVYEAPAIVWEQPFVALAQTSICGIPGESDCGA